MARRRSIGWKSQKFFFVTKELHTGVTHAHTHTHGNYDKSRQKRRSERACACLCQSDFLPHSSLPMCFFFFFFLSGDNVELTNVEFHDVRVAAMMFGQAAIVNGLVNGVSPNQASQWTVGRNKMGFQFYVSERERRKQMLALAVTASFASAP